MIGELVGTKNGWRLAWISNKSNLTRKLAFRTKFMPDPVEGLVRFTNRMLIQIWLEFVFRSTTSSASKCSPSMRGGLSSAPALIFGRRPLLSPSLPESEN